MNELKIFETRGSIKSKVTFLAVIIIVYVLLFEFILPINKVLPKPSLLLESFISLFSDYGLLSASAISTSAVYLSIFVSYILFSIVAPLKISFYYKFPFFISIVGMFRFFPAFFYAVIFAFWFPFSVTAEFVYAFIAVSFMIGISLFNELPKVKPEYIDAARSLKIKETQIYSKIIWKSIQLELFSSLRQIHIYLWAIVLLYEFIGETDGFGNVYRDALSFNDLSGLFALAIITGLFIWLGDVLINYFKGKIINWES
ncbi:MAG: hypothetical protein K9J16_10720 [Melioribacteraceae bacterium]|nr:hypothetical protein [Melioribacteraceae bacterium]MCF8355191.1 hypothetical protein [Melioribacteraceae bacterium]MCF8395404.1 hypothetical protein [Melioribacteraceae bacterium]MCF8419890.1 hypothetical protein [Melioribacteraceae bacterium]